MIKDRLSNYLWGGHLLGHACLGHNSVFLELYTRQNVGSQLSMHTFGPDGGYCLCVLRVKGVTTMGVVWQNKIHSSHPVKCL